MDIKLCVVIPTKESIAIKKCLNSLYLLDVKKDIYVVDSKSTDKSYLLNDYDVGELLYNNDITLIENNSNYEVGALWRVLNEIDIENYTHIMLMQDSMFFKKKFTKEDIDIKSDVMAYNSVKEKNKPTNLLNLPKAAFIRNVCGFNYQKDFISFFCVGFIANTKSINKLLEIRFDEFKPVSRQESMLSERLIGLVFGHINAKLSHKKLAYWIGKNFYSRP